MVGIYGHLKARKYLQVAQQYCRGCKGCNEPQTCDTDSRRNQWMTDSGKLVKPVALTKATKEANKYLKCYSPDKGEIKTLARDICMKFKDSEVLCPLESYYANFFTFYIV